MANGRKNKQAAPDLPAIRQRLQLIAAVVGLSLSFQYYFSAISALF
jgi:hypothetical protein